MPVWSVAPISARPSVTLTHWLVFEVTDPDEAEPRTRHLAGWSVDDRQGQVSSPIRAFDPAARSFVTGSGRVYTVAGESGSHPDAEHVLARWLRINEPSEFVDVTKQVELDITHAKRCSGE
jgi:hypothetical protein